MTSNIENVVRQLIEEGFNKGNMDVVNAVTSPVLVEHQNYGPNHAAGAEGVRAVVASLRRAFPDFRLTIEDLVVSVDRVWLRMVATGTNTGSYMGHASTGRSIRIDVFDVIRVENGLMVEHWGVPDRLGVLSQLALLNPPAGVKPAESRTVLQAGNGYGDILVSAGISESRREPIETIQCERWTAPISSCASGRPLESSTSGPNRAFTPMPPNLSPLSTRSRPPVLNQDKGRR